MLPPKVFPLLVLPDVRVLSDRVRLSPAVSELVIFVRERENFAGERLAGASTIAVIALLYSLWAISGTGSRTVFWGLILLLSGLPVFWWQSRKSGSAMGGEAT